MHGGNVFYSENLTLYFKAVVKTGGFGNSTLVCQRHFNALFFKNFIGDFQSADRFGKAHIGSALIKCFFYFYRGSAGFQCGLHLCRQAV